MAQFLEALLWWDVVLSPFSMLVQVFALSSEVAQRGGYGSCVIQLLKMASNCFSAHVCFSPMCGMGLDGDGLRVVPDPDENLISVFTN